MNYAVVAIVLLAVFVGGVVLARHIKDELHKATDAVSTDVMYAKRQITNAVASVHARIDGLEAAVSGKVTSIERAVTGKK